MYIYGYLGVLNAIYLVALVAACITGAPIGTCLSMTHSATLVVLAGIVARKMWRERRRA